MVSLEKQGFGVVLGITMFGVGLRENRNWDKVQTAFWNFRCVRKSGNRAENKGENEEKYSMFAC